MITHDGWAVKTKEGRVLPWSYAETKTELKQHKMSRLYWRELKKQGARIVRINLIEVVVCCVCKGTGEQKEK